MLSDEVPIGEADPYLSVLLVPPNSLIFLIIQYGAVVATKLSQIN